MQSDLAGRIRNTRLPVSNALLPLFEAVVNATDAIRDARRKDGRIDISIVRGASLFSSSSDGDGTDRINGFAVTDNGIGFTAQNYESFSTLDTLNKAAIGGKGVGRLVWLVAFDRVSVDSHFEEEGKWWNRSFKFERTANGIEEMTLVEAPRGAGARTVIRLGGFRTQYEDAAPKSARAIAKRIIEHCLVSFMLDDMPAVTIIDPAAPEPLELNKLYAEEFVKKTSPRQFIVSGHNFEIVDALLRPSSEADHAIHFCANKRAVISTRVAGMIAHVDAPLAVGDDRVLYAGCVTSKLLDEHVNTQRTGFDLFSDGELPLGATSITWSEIAKAATVAVSEFLAPALQTLKAQSLSRIRKFVEEEEPRYRILLDNKQALLDEIPSNLSDERLELELHKKLASWRHEAKVDAARRLKAVPNDAAEFAQFEQEALRALGELQEVAKADLADYVLHRRTVLDFFEKLLGLGEDGKFAREEALHGLFFPLRKTSNNVDYEDHNLWVIDERLAFHHYLASDLPLGTAGSKSTGANLKRPDLLIYDQRMAFTAENMRPFGSIVLVEFKRPDRNNYDGDDNPIAQIYDYIRDLREGRARNADGSSVDQVTGSVPFFCHILVTLSPSLRKQLENMGFTAGPDGQNYFTFNQGLHAYVEVSSYSRLLQEAVKRNKAFFDKLGLPTGIGRA